MLIDGTTRVLTTASNPGSTVRIGYLSTAGDASSFQQFAESPVTNSPSLPMPAGFLSASSTNNTAGIAGISVIADKMLVLWVIGQNGQEGMFTSTEWTVPANFGTGVDNSHGVVIGRTMGGGTPPVVTTIPLPGFNAASYAAPVTIAFGLSSNPNASSYVLGSPIPEPSAVNLAGLLAALAFRRKR